MRTMSKSLLLLGGLIATLLGHRCYAESFIGVWQTETNGWSGPNSTNKIEAMQTVEFFRDHSFKLTQVTVVAGRRWTNVPYTGTYVMVGTNRASLKVIPHNVSPRATPLPAMKLC